ncbi:CopG family ribbon-helix-helix protein [Ferrovibrio sp.]|uniref:CopG family ribbon-helix-helix protein n=1 Tax=Ferrovibrio sp. TaxID=1917215 RepID=UPI0035B11742
MPKTATITARIDPELNEALERIAAAQGRSKSWVLNEAARRFVDFDGWYAASVSQGLQDADAGRLVPHEQAMAAIDGVIARAKKRVGKN